MANQWFKFYGAEFLSDPKIGNLTAQERSIWITLLSLASLSESGVIKYLTVETLLTKSGIQLDPYRPEEWENCLGILTKLERMKMVNLNTDNGEVIITHWQARQECNLTNAERQAKYREKHKENKDSNTEVTKPSNESNARREEKRREERDIAETSSAVWDFKAYKKTLEDTKRRHLNIIALYWDFKTPVINSLEQARADIKRNVRPAQELVSFEDNRIVKTMEFLNTKVNFKWTLETVLKYITEKELKNA